MLQNRKDFITTEDWTLDELESALELAGDLKRQWITGTYHDHLLRAKTLYMIFFEESTRTRNSFEAGMTQLGGHALVDWLRRSPRRERQGHSNGAGALWPRHCGA
jgi:ornithine carbamoyltransferase